MKQVVILYEQNGNMNCAEVILYDEIHDAVPYIKRASQELGYQQ